MNTKQQSGFLDRIERVGNRLPDPASLFCIGALAVVVIAEIAVRWQWSADKTLLNAGSAGATETVVARSLLDSEGIWWVLSHMVENFIRFPPLGIVLVGMLGIGLAERSGLVSALLRAAMRAVSGPWLTPSVIFLGIMSSLGLDAGYVVLPPLAAVIYQAVGRSPLAGIAAVFAGVSAGFSANLVITAVDPLLAGLTQAAAAFIEPDYTVAVTANWWLMIVSAFVLTLTGWAISSWWVEPRVATATDAPAEPASQTPISTAERRGLWSAALVLLAVLTVLTSLVLIPDAPLHGIGKRFPRVIEVTVPLLFIFFFIPALAYGIGADTIRSDRDAARMLGETMATMGPYLVLVFFAAQFIEFFKYTGLGEMLAVSGANGLAHLDLAPVVLVLTFVLVVMFGNLLIGSASAKYAVFAPVFVPMFMQLGISPELTQAAYRVGDSVTNVITPFNPYMVIIVANIQRFAPQAGLGSVVALMLPYAVGFGAVWMVILAVWVLSGLPLGPGGGLTYP